MKRAIVGIVILVLLIGGIFLFLSFDQVSIAPSENRVKKEQSQPSKQSKVTAPLAAVVAEGLDTPWSIAFLPDNSMLITERAGRVRFIDSEGILSPNSVVTLANVTEVGEGGLLGIAIHPDFVSNKFVYLYYTYSNSGNNTLNRVVRMTFTNEQLTDERIIIDQIPGASNHNGGRIKFGPDNNLYVGTGDAQEPSQAQSTSTLAGKILRVTDTGGPVVSGNPARASENRSYNELIFSYGHRNVQGLAWDSNGVLWATEHGPSGSQTGNDEVNKITVGKNYGWPDIQGTQTKSGMESPIATSGTNKTWAPAGAAIIGQSLYFGGLRGTALYEFDMQTQGEVTTHFADEFGRIRDVITGPDGMLYLTTSNKDGRGNPQNGDDRVIRVNPEKL